MNQNSNFTTTNKSLFILQNQEGNQQKEIFVKPKSNQNRNQTVRNIIQISNIQFLLKFVKFTDFNYQTIFEKIKQEAQKQELSSFIDQTLTNINKKKPKPNIKPSYFQKQILIPYTKFTKSDANQRQNLFSQQVKKQVQHALNKTNRSRVLTIEQLKSIAQNKIKQQKLNESKQLQKSRRSFEYIQQLKMKINSNLTHEVIEKKQQTLNVKQEEIIMRLQSIKSLEKQKMNIKIEFYYYQKSQKHQDIKIANNLKEKWIQNLSNQYEQIIKVFSLIKQMQLIVEQLQGYLRQQRSTLQKKHKIYSKLSQKSMKLNHYFEQNQKFLNTFMLDKRELQISTFI